MSPATRPPVTRDAVRLLRVNAARGTFVDGDFAELREALQPGDLLVVNDAATLPASLPGVVHGQPIEVRLLGLAEPEQAGAEDRWLAVVFGDGDWRQDTNDRPPPPALELGDVIELGDAVRAELVDRDPNRPGVTPSGRAAMRRPSPRGSRPGTPFPEHASHARGPLQLRFEARGDLYAALYAIGRPVQYSHLADPLELWSVQTVFASRPWAVEMPSAGRALTAKMLADLRRRGVELARLTHAAGLSATGDRQLDALLPLPERYEIPAETVAAIARTRGRGGRVIAVGTTVVRALEGAAARDGIVRAGPGVTDLIITPDRPLRIVDALLTGMHEPSESHYRLLGAFTPRALLERAWDCARAWGYRSHEFGDLALLG